MYSCTNYSDRTILVYKKNVSNNLLEDIIRYSQKILVINNYILNNSNSSKFGIIKTSYVIFKM